MHIPPYAQNELLDAMPARPSEDQTLGLTCSLCGEPFTSSGRQRVPVEPENEDSLYACRSCVNGFVTRIRQERFTASKNTEQRKRGPIPQAVQRYLSSSEKLRRAGEAVGHFAETRSLKPVELAWLMISLESAYNWLADTEATISSLPASAGGQTEAEEAKLALFIQMCQARHLAADAFAYHFINESTPAEPDMCAEFECAPDCDGRHDADHIDCGPDEIYDALAAHGVTTTTGEDSEDKEHEQGRPNELG